ncbi:glutathione S- transferase, nitrogen catabolite repression regulator [Steccherinum ochraceum]|uniref:Glutathione S-transferase, nitrogen catabolite repression regulator n=1 Tax=Steccherinum ochraceum TaxID=92696 RepID=A0A4R0RP37_9APHY|nr:glutathione S- transferase, nitrogen catabolite repression regulator [Steccherinum ochraceum]
MAAPTSNKPVILYSETTPNGIVVSAYLEELKDKYGAPDYEAIKLSIRDADIGKVHLQVKSPWFLEINPNGRIPAITHNGFPVFETSAILLYLSQQFDKDHVFSRDVNDVQAYSQELQWLFFAHGGIGPMQGQAGHFIRAAPEKIPYGIKRYSDETKRLYGVLESRLKNREYLLDNGFGIADIKAWGWVRSGPRLSIELDEFPKVKAWVEKIENRPAVQRGLNIPASN